MAAVGLVHVSPRLSADTGPSRDPRATPDLLLIVRTGPWAPKGKGLAQGRTSQGAGVII